MSFRFPTMKQANTKIEALEAQLRAQGVEPIATQPAHTGRARIAAPPTGPVSTFGKLTRAQCEADMQGVFRESRLVVAGASDGELFEDVRARLVAARLNCPALGIVEAGPAPGYTTRYIRSLKQERLDAILKPKKP